MIYDDGSDSSSFVQQIIIECPLGASYCSKVWALREIRKIPAFVDVAGWREKTEEDDNEQNK